MSDPVASKSAFLCLYMKSHPDTVVAYVKHYGNVPGNVTTAEIKSIDSQGMHLAYTLVSGGVGAVRVKFDPPLAGYEEVKPRLLAMKADAQEALGMLRTPKLTSFRLPLRALFMPAYFLAGTYFTHAPARGTALPFLSADVTDLVFAPAYQVFRWIGFRLTMSHVFKIAAVCHVVETAYTWSLCRRYVDGTWVKASYILATLVFGFPIWTDLKKRVRDKRIESVMKME